MTATAIAPELKEKTCTACNESWPADKEFFFPGGKTKDGLMSKCKACYESKRRFRPSFSGSLTAELQGLFTQIIQKTEHTAHANS